MWQPPEVGQKQWRWPASLEGLKLAGVCPSAGRAGSLLLPDTCPAVQALSWTQDLCPEVPEHLVPCVSEVCRKCTGGFIAHSNLLSAPGWRELNESGAQEKLEYWLIY